MRCFFLFHITNDSCRMWV